MGHRLYDPALGRFLQTDPIAGGSANDYDYVAGDPINKVDLYGNICWSCAGRHLANAVRRVGTSPIFQVAVTAVACGFGGLGACAIANYGFAAVNSANRFAQHGTFNNPSDWAWAAVDVAAATVQYQTFQKGTSVIRAGRYGAPILHGRGVPFGTKLGATGYNVVLGGVIATGIDISHRYIGRL